MTSCMRLCPSVEGSASPLITHRIGLDVCLARQRTFFHKCHRCIYRGQAANWEPEAASPAMINVHAAEELTRAAVPGFDLARRPAKASGKTSRRKPASAEKAAEAG